MGSTMSSDDAFDVSTLEAALDKYLSGGEDKQARKTVLQGLLTLLGRIVAGKYEDNAGALAPLAKAASRGDDARRLVSLALAESLWFTGLEICPEGESVNPTDPSVQRLACAFRGVADSLDVGAIKPMLEYDMLQALGLVALAKTLDRRTLQINVTENYKIPRASLFHEQIEGYARVVVELGETVAPPSADLVPACVESVAARILAIIGRFELDPERVLSLAIQWCQAGAPQKAAFRLEVLAGLIPKQPAFALRVIRSRLAHYQRPEATKQAPMALFDLIARLIRDEAISVDDVYPLLKPTDAEAAAALQSLLTDVQKKKDRQGKDFFRVTLAVKENQKQRLLETVLKGGDFVTAHSMCQRMSALLPMSHGAVLRAYCQTLARTTAPYYDSIAFNPEGAVQAIPITSASVGGLYKALLPAYHVGCYLSADPLLFTKVCRLVKASLGVKDLDAQLREKTIKLVKKVLMPSLMLLTGNAGATFEVWEAIKDISWQERYKIYAAARDAFDGSPELVFARNEAATESKKVLRRISNDEHSGTIAGKKLARFANITLVTMDCILNQIESYSNLINSLVDSLKFLTPLGCDIAGYLIVDRLMMRNRGATKDGTLTAQWLSGLATFASHSGISLEPLLAFATNSVKSGETQFLPFLREMISGMALIEVTDASYEISAVQIESLAGGETLKAESSPQAAGRIGTVKHESVIKRLTTAFKNTGLIVPLYVSLARLRNVALFQNDAPDTRVLCDSVDKCQDALIQYLEFLLSYVSPLSQIMPDVGTLVSYKLDPEAVFHARRITTNYQELDDSAMQALVSTVRTSFAGQRLWESITPELYTTFWSLSLHDLFVPEAAYRYYSSKASEYLSREAPAQEDAAKALDEDERKKKQKAIRKERDRAAKVIKSLQDELDRQSKSHQAIRARLDKDKLALFAKGSVDDHKKCYAAVIQHCIVPRIYWSFPDAVYCARFILTLHELRTPNFGTLTLLEQVFKDIPQMLFCCSEKEAANIGQFLHELLAVVNRWSAQDRFAELAASPGAAATGDSTAPTITRSEFETLLHFWHKNVFSVYNRILRSKVLVELKNGMYSLSKLVPTFPLYSDHGHMLDTLLGNIAKEERAKKTEARSDIVTLAKRCQGKIMETKQSWKGARTATQVVHHTHSNSSSSSTPKAVLPAVSPAHVAKPQAPPSPVPAPASPAPAPAAAPASTSPKPRADKTPDSKQVARKASPSSSPDLREKEREDRDKDKDRERRRESTTPDESDGPSHKKRRHEDSKSSDKDKDRDKHDHDKKRERESSRGQSPSRDSKRRRTEESATPPRTPSVEREKDKDKERERDHRDEREHSHKRGSTTPTADRPKDEHPDRREKEHSERHHRDHSRDRNKSDDTHAGSSTAPSSPAPAMHPPKAPTPSETSQQGSSDKGPKIVKLSRSGVVQQEKSGSQSQQGQQHVGPNSNTFIKSIRQKIVDLRAPYLVCRPYGTPVVNCTVAMCPREEAGATSTVLAVAQSVDDNHDVGWFQGHSGSLGQASAAPSSGQLCDALSIPESEVMAEGLEEREIIGFSTGNGFEDCPCLRPRLSQEHNTDGEGDVNNGVIVEDSGVDESGFSSEGKDSLDSDISDAGGDYVNDRERDDAADAEGYYNRDGLFGTSEDSEKERPLKRARLSQEEEGEAEAEVVAMVEHQDDAEVPAEVETAQDEAVEVELELEMSQDEVVEVELELEMLPDEVAEVELELELSQDEAVEVELELEMLQDEAVELELETVAKQVAEPQVQAPTILLDVPLQRDTDTTAGSGSGDDDQ
eukprot:m51a1_g3438 hypothetical protein (1790) ;mRNA; r:644169-651808